MSPTSARRAGHRDATRSAGSVVRRPLLLAVVLGSVTAIGPLAIDMYIPAFPTMGTDLGASDAAIQATMSAFLAGFVLGQLVIGPASDATGRRRPLVGGLGAFAVLSAVCALAPTVEVLAGARFLQGVAGAAGAVLARAVLTDLFAGADLPRYVAVQAQVLALAPIVSPVIGGAIVSSASWRLVFVLLTTVGVVVLLVVIRQIPETLPPERRRPGGLRVTAGSMASLLRRRAFVGYWLVLGFSGAALFVYASASSFVFEDVLGLDPRTYSVIFAVNALGMLGAGVLFGRLARRWSVEILVGLGVGVASVGAVAQVLLALTVGVSVAGTWVCLFLLVAGVALVVPSVMTVGQTLARDAAGTGSALLGSLQFVLGAALAPVVGLLGEGSALPMAVVMLIAMALAVLSLVVLARPGKGCRDPAAEPTRVMDGHAGR